MIVFGLWIKHFVEQQIKSKDASIQSLESVIKAKDAEIAGLAKESSPVVVAKYQQIKIFADDMAQNSIDLQKRLEASEAERLTLTTSMENQLLQARRETLGVITSSFSRAFAQLRNSENPSYGGQDLMTVLTAVVGDVTELTRKLVPGR